ncbi:MAG: protein translocase subunit SecF, partial [Nanoarchaeota archaeon]
QEQHKKNWHDKHYKKLLLIPLALLIFSFVYMGIFYSQNNDFFLKDISLMGGTSVTINGNVDIIPLKNALVDKFGEVNVREVSDLITGEQLATIVETTAKASDIKAFLEDYLGYKLIEGENSSFESTDPSLGKSFYNQLLIAILISFVFMAIVVFIIFRTVVPSGAVIISAFADILMTLVAINLLGIKMSSGGIIALLMLIGYSVDTDILLTNRVLKRQEGSLNERLVGAFKTGLTMTLTSLVAVAVALLVVKSFSVTLTQIFTILAIGLIFDIFNTWITNVSILKWYVLSKERRGQE